MKVGILTYHRAENYGALLQSYALMTYLKGLGHDVSFVDYWPEYHEDYFRVFPIKKFKEGKLPIKLYCLYMALVWGFARNKRKRVFQRFIRDYFGLGQTIKYRTDRDVCSEFDLVFYGSDQIWREQGLPGHKGRDYWYWGSDNILARKYAFAASMGASSWDSEEKPVLTDFLRRFSAISVRENSLKMLLEDNGIEAVLVSDPVFLLNKTQWQALESSSELRYSSYSGKQYILFYNLLNSSESSRFAEELSRKTHCPIVEITKAYGFDKLGKRYVHDASVQDFLSLIEHATYVVSNSFHGVALSIIFEKQFFAVGMGNRSDRVRSLLHTLHLDSRYLDEPVLDMINKINYEEVKGLMGELSESSKSFIGKSIGQ